jgi:hypothetical protein
MKMAKRVLVAAIVLTLSLGVIYLALFTTVELPQGADTDSRSALVLKHYRPAYLNPGDWVWVEIGTDTVTSNALRRLARIQPPDPANAPRNRRRLARQIMEMDYKPTYLVSATGFDTNELVAVAEYRIKGKVIHIFNGAAR